MKIFQPSKITFHGKPCEVMGVAGDSRVLDYFLANDPEWDLSEEAFYQSLGIPELSAVTTFIVVTSDRVGLVEIDPTKGTWRHISNDRAVVPAVAIGTGAIRLEKILPYSFDARLYVTFASYFDRRTGGDLRVWDNGVFSNERRQGCLSTICKLFKLAFGFRR